MDLTEFITCIIAFILGILIAYILSNILGYNDIIEGHTPGVAHSREDTDHFHDDEEKKVSWTPPPPVTPPLSVTSPPPVTPPRDVSLQRGIGAVADAAQMAAMMQTPQARQQISEALERRDEILHLQARATTSPSPAPETLDEWTVRALGEDIGEASDMIVRKMTSTPEHIGDELCSKFARPMLDTQCVPKNMKDDINASCKVMVRHGLKGICANDDFISLNNKIDEISDKILGLYDESIAKLPAGERLSYFPLIDSSFFETIRDIIEEVPDVAWGVLRVNPNEILQKLPPRGTTLTLEDLGIMNGLIESYSSLKTQIDDAYRMIVEIQNYKNGIHTNLCEEEGQILDANTTCDFFDNVLDHYEGTCCENKWAYVDHICGKTSERRNKHNIPPAAQCNAYDFPGFTNVLQEWSQSSRIGTPTSGGG